MNRYCPVFLLECCAAIAADKYLTATTLPLEVFCKKISDHINKFYIQTSHELIVKVADSYLRVLVESNSESANEVLYSYLYSRLNFRRGGKKRNWASALANPVKGSKELAFDFGLSRRNFRAFVFAHKNHAANTRANNWRLETFKHEEFIKDMASFEYSGFDFLN